MTAPSLNFSGDTNTGIYSSAADTLDIATGGVQAASFGATALIRAAPEDARTNTVDVALTIRSTTSGTPAAGIGVGLQFEAKSADENPSVCGRLDFVATDVTAASEDTVMDILLRTAGGVEGSRYRFEATGAFRGGFTHGITANRTWTLPDATGTLALTSDIGPRSYLAGLTLSRSAATTLGIAVGTCRDGTNAQNITIASAFTKTSAAWAVGSGNGGLLAGTFAANTWFHVYAIFRSDTSVSDIGFEAATTPTLPTGYTHSRRIGSFRTDGASTITDFTQDGDYFRWKASVLDVDAANPGTAAVTRTLTVPTGVNVHAMYNVALKSNTVSTFGYMSDLDSNDEAVSSDGSAAPLNQVLNTGSSSYFGAFAITRTNTSAQIRSRLGASDANTGLRIATLGWIDYRGRNA